MKTEDLINVNTCYVVTKKYNKKIYFVKKNYSYGWGRTLFYKVNDRISGKSTIDVNSALLFNNRAEAAIVCQNKNLNRKKIYYKIESATNYFVCSWTHLGLDGDYSTEATIKNRLSPISEKLELQDIKSAYDKGIVHLERRSKDILSGLDKQIKRVQEERLIFETMVKEFKTLDLSQFDKYKNKQAGDMYNILFGKDNVK